MASGTGSGEAGPPQGLELEWLLRDKLPVSFMQLGVLLQECLRLLLPRTAMSRRSSTSSVASANGMPSRSPRRPPAAEVQPVTVLAAERDGSIQGNVRVDGSAITVAELRLAIPPKHPYTGPGGEKMFATRIQAVHPWNIRQLRHVCNYVRKTLAELEEGLLLMKTAVDPAARTRDILARTIALLTRARSELAVASFIEPADAMGRHLELMPNPPPTILVDAVVSDSGLTFQAVFCVEASNPASQRQRRPGTALAPGQWFPSKGRKYQIVGVSRAVAAVPCLRELSSKLSLLLRIAQQSEDKLRALSGT